MADYCAAPWLVFPPPLTSSLSIERATVDDVALALVALNEQHSELCRLSGALKEVHDLARKQGALGDDNAVTAAARQLGERP